MDNIALFEGKWDRFRSMLKGNMLTKCAGTGLSCSYAKLLLDSAKGYWVTGEGGAWLKEYSAVQPVAGAMIRDILLKDITFTEVAVKKDRSGFITGAACVAGFLAGWGVAGLFAPFAVVRAAAGAASSAAAIPGANIINKSICEKNTANVIELYMSQLEKYKNSVKSILNSNR